MVDEGAGVGQQDDGIQKKKNVVNQGVVGPLDLP